MFSPGVMPCNDHTEIVKENLSRVNDSEYDHTVTGGIHQEKNVEKCRLGHEIK